MPFVLDASVALAWAFEDETDPYTELILDLLNVDTALVPAIWPLEVTNCLLAAERRQRLPGVRIARYLAALRGLSIAVSESSLEQASTVVLDVARRHGLTTYDAAYLELAARQGYALATLDKRLRQAAKQDGIPLACTDT